MKLTMTTESVLDNGSHSECSITISSVPGRSSPDSETLKKVRSAMHAALTSAAETYNDWMSA